MPPANPFPDDPEPCHAGRTAAGGITPVAPEAVPAWAMFWGKGQPDDARPKPYPRFHPVVWHLLDVAATIGAILDARPATRARGARLLGVTPDVLRQLLVVLAGLHDLGKFAPAFQAKEKHLWPAHLGAYRVPAKTHHTDDGYALWSWRGGLHRTVGPRIWSGAPNVLDTLAPAVFGHHGRPVRPEVGVASDLFRVGPLATPLDAALACAEAVTALLLPEPITARPPDGARVRRASWWVAGLLTLADWVGSRQAWFPYEPANLLVAEYWERAQKRAADAVRAAGLKAAPAAGARTFFELTRYADPSPTQAWAADDAPLPNGPTLVIVEDVTGAGKTEAAQMLVHRLMAAGHASGAYWAMPTQATANAMYARQGEAVHALYAADEGARPSLALAHGQARLHARFRASVLDAPAPRDVPRASGAAGPPGPELESGAACAAFLADDRRAALMADVGAGTIDQAVLGVLPSRFNTLRLLGLSDKVLVLDEAHAYDAYVAEEVQTLLRFHAALGGSAVVLSATLSRAQRQELVGAWLDGSADGRRVTAPTVQAQAYPLATVVDGVAAAVSEHPLKAARTSARTVAVRFVHAEATAAETVAAAHARGAATCWIRNTVRDCLAAAAGLRARGVPVLVFHARFAQGDRQRRERLVVRLFGKAARDARRRRCVLLATQVVEQSLDLDFDVLVSDVAPVDLLIQRAGRLWRHTTRNPAREAAGLIRELVVLTPPFEQEPPKDWVSGLLPGTAAVYRDAGVLWRTVEALDDARVIVTPGTVGESGAVRTLVEAVYGDGARERTPKALQPAADHAEGENKAAKSTARYVVLSVADGYHGATKGWVDDVRAPTRLGGDQIALRLARVMDGRRLDPWVAPSAGEPAWKCWALSEVRVSTRRVRPGSAAPAKYTAAVDSLRRTWGRFEQDVPVLALTETATPGEWSGALLAPNGSRMELRYTHADGLILP